MNAAAADLADLAADRLARYAAAIEAAQKGDSMDAAAQTRTLGLEVADVESALVQLAAACPKGSADRAHAVAQTAAVRLYHDAGEPLAFVTYARWGREWRARGDEFECGEDPNPETPPAPEATPDE